MSRANTFPIYRGWQILLKDLGIHPANVLRRAGLPGDLLGRDTATLGTRDYFRLWKALDEEAGDPELPIRIGEALSFEHFDSAIFAALCSPDLNTALERLSDHKRLIGPMALHVDAGTRATSLTLEYLDKTVDPPGVLVASELVFFVQLARYATRERIVPVRITAPRVLEPAKAFARFFGRPVDRGNPSLRFSARDANRPFLTENRKMWEFFAPELRRRLSDLDESATTVDRVRGALVELLPSANSSLPAVATRLAMSARTLQRRLLSEGVSFQEVLDATRADLGRHYLGETNMSGAEISYLLGFEDPNSFYRAFQKWTGGTPERFRMEA